MTHRGHVRNGTIVLDEPLTLPEGAAVDVNVRDTANPSKPAPKRDIAKLIEGLDYDFEAFERLREASKL